MGSEIILTNNEFIGSIVNPNLRFYIDNLSTLRIGIDFITFAKNEEWAIEEAIINAIERSGLIFIIGDIDIAGRIIAKISQKRLIINKDILQSIKKYFENKGIEVPKDYENRALIPQNAILMPNSAGIDPGFIIRHHSKNIIFLPERGEGLEVIIKDHLNPFLEGEDLERDRYKGFIVKNFGISKLYIKEKLKQIEGIDIKVVNAFPENHIYIEINDNDPHDIENRVINIFGNYIFGKDDETLEGVIGRLLKEAGKTISIAESCTGGFITHLLTNIPGSSEYFCGGVVTYSNSSKEEILKVPLDIIEKYGAVSSNVALKMAKGVKDIYKSSIGAGITGIAGPGGGTLQKPVGTVFISIISDDREVVKGFRFKGNREEIKILASYMFMELLRRQLVGIYS